MITSDKVKEKYLDFFEKRGHKRISPAPLVLENDPTTLFTSSGMQPIVPFLTGEEHPEGKRLVDYQPCVRTVDIDEVGDNRHLTYFEMLGNWSLGDYFKEEQLPWIWEFLTIELGLDQKKLAVTVSSGGKNIPEDIESYEIWKKIGVKEDRIYKYPIEEENWWSRSGKPDDMPVGEIGGPDSEIFFEFTNVVHNSKFGKICHPNCECGRFLEIGNSVFIEYIKNKNGEFEDLPNKNIDFGGGLERITASLNNDPDIFKTDIFWPTIEKLEKITNKKYEEDKRNFRIIADHLRSSEALIENGVTPSNKQQGYVLRRLIRRMAIKSKEIKNLTANNIILEELNHFEKTLENGLKEVKKIDKIDGKLAFDLYQTYGLPLELTIEFFSDKGQEVDKEEFKKEFEKHKEMSRSTSAGMFKGGLSDHSEETTKLHTVTHLLHASLRKILGDGVSQKGSHITSERLRFDFSYTEKLTDEQIKKVFDLINQKIDEDLPVTFIETTPKEAIKGEKIKIYSMGDFSKEVCGGPHVENTNKLGRVKIIKQEKIGSGVVRIYIKFV